MSSEETQQPKEDPKEAETPQHDQETDQNSEQSQQDQDQQDAGKDQLEGQQDQDQDTEQRQKDQQPAQDQRVPEQSQQDEDPKQSQHKQEQEQGQQGQEIEPKQGQQDQEQGQQGETEPKQGQQDQEQALQGHKDQEQGQQDNQDQEQGQQDQQDPGHDEQQGEQPSPEVSSSEQRRSSFQNHALHTYTWEPTGDIKALLYLCHGIHEYMGRYELLAQHLKNNNILVFGLDLVGHGRSEGDRGYILDIQSYATDVIAYIEDMKAKYPSVPMFLMGHSMGGLIATMVAIQRADLFTGLLLSAPALDIDPAEAGVVFKFIAKVLAAIIPKVGIKSVDYHLISSIPEEAEEYNNDPLIFHGPMKAGTGVALLKSIQLYQPQVHEISLPLFLMHGTADRLVPLHASELIYNNAASTDKTYELFAESFHEILHDKEQERARQLISAWILARLNGPVLLGAVQEETEEVIIQT